VEASFFKILISSTLVDFICNKNNKEMKIELEKLKEIIDGIKYTTTEDLDPTCCPYKWADWFDVVVVDELLELIEKECTK
jgi:hypothetical protein